MNTALRHSLLATAVLMCFGTPSFSQGVNARDNNGWTALMVAAYRGQTDQVEALIAAGADVNAKDGKGETALLKAVFVPRAETYKTNQAMPADVCFHRQIVGLPGCTWTVKNTRQLEAGAGNVDCVKALIAAGADLKAKDRDGMTALVEAAALGNVDCVKALIVAGADVNAKAKHGQTALTLTWSTDVKGILLAAGAKK